MNLDLVLKFDILSKGKIQEKIHKYSDLLQNLSSLFLMCFCHTSRYIYTHTHTSVYCSANKQKKKKKLRLYGRLDGPCCESELPENWVIAGDLYHQLDGKRKNSGVVLIEERESRKKPNRNTCKTKAFYLFILEIEIDKEVSLFLTSFPGKSSIDPLNYITKAIYFSILNYVQMTCKIRMHTCGLWIVEWSI